MDPLAFVSLALRRWWLFVLLGLLGVAGGYLEASASPRHYQSTISLQLNPAARSSFLRYDSSVGGPSSVSAAAALAASYIEVLKSRAFAAVVVQQLQIPAAPESITRGIDVKLIPNTNILRLAVVWDNPQDAEQLAQKIAEIFIAENIQRQYDGGAPRVQDLEASARQLQARLSGLRQQRDRLDEGVTRGDLTHLTELNDLETRLSALETTNANLLVEINQARSSVDTAAILDNASPAQSVGTSLPVVLAIGLVLGLGAAAGLALLLDHLADAVRSPEDVVAIAHAAPLVAVGHAPPQKGARAGASASLLVGDASRSPVAEAFRTLRANLTLAALDRPLHSLVVTSAGPGEGKTFVAINVAVALAQAGSRVLLVDADLRRPAIHNRFGVPNEVGLVAALLAERPSAAGDELGEPLVGIVPSGIARVSLLPGGGAPPNPAELLGSATMKRLLSRWSSCFDIVVIDTPPVGPVADALLLMVASDAALVVARAGRTRRAALDGVLNMLRGAGAPVLGVVLNDLHPGPLARYTQYGYYYSGYYGTQDQDPVKGSTAAPLGPLAADQGHRVRQEVNPQSPRATNVAVGRRGDSGD